MATDQKQATALAARRVREKKARDTLADSYVKKLIRQSDPEMLLDHSDISWELVAAARMRLAVRRRLWGRSTPEMDAAMKDYLKALERKIGEKSNGKTRL